MNLEWIYFLIWSQIRSYASTNPFLDIFGKDVRYTSLIVKPALHTTKEQYRMFHTVRNSKLRCHFAFIDKREYAYLKFKEVFVENVVAYHALSEEDRLLADYFIEVILSNAD